ncbi:SDR family oxidoreductase [Candidatus Sumerlaeota bacterium]|nr:SDR family oxidoreductase [Candidatus Sumerlaeota bacterium]MBI3736010.1 SDR family oxidoreductase [Candidatus Sumerlaeota bacterium]
MELGLKDKVAIITGGASGLGRETAHYMAREGMKIIIADRHMPNIGKVVKEVNDLGAEAEGIKIDVRDYADCERMADLALEKFGGIDVLLAGAGIADSKLFLTTTPSDWDEMLDINIRGVLNANRAIAPHLIERKGGSIINIASEAGKVGEKRMVVYSATKGAVIGFTKALSVEMGRFNVRVNAVCPGVTHTPMTANFTPDQIAASTKFYPMGRLGQPADIAAMITFLASDQTSWVTGQAISVSGGFGRS